MSKYYIKSNTLELIYSTDKTPLEAAIVALGETNKWYERLRYSTSRYYCNPH